MIRAVSPRGKQEDGRGIGVTPVRTKPGTTHCIAARSLARALVRVTRSASVPWLRRFPSRSEEHTSALQSLMRLSYAVLCLTKKNQQQHPYKHTAETIIITT